MNKNIEERKRFAKENNLLKYQLKESDLIPRLLAYICESANKTNFPTDYLSTQILIQLKETFSNLLNKIQKERNEYTDKISSEIRNLWVEEKREDELIENILHHLTRINCLEELNNVKVLFNSIVFINEFLERILMESNINVSIEDLTENFEDREIKIDLQYIDMKNISIYLSIIQNITESIKKENGKGVINIIAKYEDSEKGKIHMGLLNAIGGMEERNLMITDIYNFVNYWKELNKRG